MSIDLKAIADQIISKIKFDLLGKRRDTYDILNFSAIEASFDSARYFNDTMYKALNFSNDLNLLFHAIKIRKIDGLILEFGVASGRTINHISSQVSQKVYGFDVFSGLPEDWRTGFVKGMFGRAELPKVNENVELIVGMFENTLNDFLKINQKPISLLHIDCDLYGGTKTIFDNLGDFIEPGTVIVFDEYFNYPGWRHHEFKAFQEFVQCKSLKYRYDSLVSTHQQVCVVVE
jgi:predicted O-methyltransferase YrrM